MGLCQGIRRFRRPASELYRDLHAASFDLPVVHETHARHRQREHGCRATALRTKRRDSTRLIVVLDESGETALKLQSCAQVGAKRLRIGVYQRSYSRLSYV